LHASASELKARAERFAERAGNVVSPIELKSLIGAGAAPERYIASWGVTLNSSLSDSELERRLRNSNPPVIVRIEDGRVVLDFRTIFDEEEDILLPIVKGIL